jgi:hypothetical protein
MSHKAACEYAIKGTKKAAIALLNAVERDLTAGVELSDYCKVWLNVATSRHFA